MKKCNVIKVIGLYFIAGVALTAGAALWHGALQGKVSALWNKLKYKKSEKIINFNKMKRRKKKGL